MKTKQVIVLVKFKSLRTGKYCAQAAHASLGSYFELEKRKTARANLVKNNWLHSSFRKIVLYVESAEDLYLIESNCEELNIPCRLITDNGTTEFNEVPTVTALGIGPWIDEEIDILTNDLKLF